MRPSDGVGSPSQGSSTMVVVSAIPPASPPVERRLSLVAAVIAVLALLTAVASPALAEDILKLTGPVTDTTGKLAAGQADIVSAIDTTRDQQGVEVWVEFIHTTGNLSANDYALQTVAHNSLGGDDALLLVALDDRTDQIWVSPGLPSITQSEVDTIVSRTLEPGLRSGDFPGAVVSTIKGLGEANTSAAPVNPAPGGGATGSTGSTGSTGGGIPVAAIIGVALIAGGGYLLFRRRRGPAASGAPGNAPGQAGGATPAPDPAALARQANALLIATDERIRDAGQETDYAEAEYGPDAVVSFRAAVAEAKDELAKAFAIRQKLDDDIPEDEPTKVAMLQEIIDRTTKAQGRLDAETDRIRELHDLEREAPARLAELPARIQAVENRLDGATKTMTGLQAYAESAWGPVRGNVEEARKGLEGARTAITAANAATAKNDVPEVAVATRTALEGVTGAGKLLDEIDQLAAAIADARRRVDGELDAATRDLADATSALAGRATDPATIEKRRAADAALAAAQTARAATPPDPIEALRLATEAHRLADVALLAAHDAAAAADRVTAAADSTVRTAAAEVDRAAAFIEARRRGVGEVARTRLAEAQRNLTNATALLATDPAGALQSGRRAQALAQEAYSLAQDDFSDWDQGGPGWGQRGGTVQGDQTTQVLGSILGGVIGGVLSGGGRGGGWGGSPWGGGGGGGLGGGWGGGGGFGSGGFGGGGGGFGGGGGGGGISGGGKW